MTYEEIRKKHISGGTSQSKSQSGTSSSYYAIRTKHGLGDEVDEDYINSYIRDFNSYASSSQKDYDGLNYKTARNYSEKYRRANDDLAYRANNIRSYLQANKDNIDSKTYEELQSYLKESSNALDTAHRTFNKANKFYSQFKNADEYNRYIAEQKYSTLDEDTFNLVKVVATGQNARSTTEGLTGFFSYWGDLLDDGNPSTYNAQKNQVAQGNAAREQLKKMGYSDTDINTWVSMNIDGRVQESQKSTKQFAEEHPVLSSAISVPYKAITAPVEAALAIDNVVRGDTDVAKSANDVLAMDDYTRKVISDKIADDSKVGAWFYDVGMSTADSTFAALMPGGTGAALLGVDVASHTTNDLLERGADPTKALFGGIAAGAFETIFEMLSIGNFKALQAVEPKTIKQVVGNLAKSMGVNASEETLTETANIVYDTLVNGSISNYQLAIDKYMADGMSPGEAKKQAIKDLAWQVGEATLSGAVQGGGMGVIGTATAYGKHKASQFITGSHIKAGNSMEAVIAAAKTLPTDSKVYKEAVKIEGKVANGEKVSSHEIGRLFSNTQDYIADNSAVTEGTFRGVNSLEELDRAYEQMKYDESKKVGGTNRETRKALESLAKEYEAAKTKLQKIEESNSTDIAQAASDAFTQAQMRVMSGESTESNSDVDTDNAETSSVDSQVMALVQQTASAEAGVAPTEFNTNPAPAEFNEDNLEEYKSSATLDIPVSQEHQLSDIEGKTILKNTNEAVNIKKITSIDKNSMTLELDDGREVSSRDISYASEGEALVYETVADITNSAESANAIINAFDIAKPKDAYAWAAGARMVYTDGKNSIPFSEIAKQDFTSYLSNEAKKLIYNLGQQDAITETAKAEKAKKTTNKKAKGKGRVTFEGKENFSTDGFTDVQRASVAYANVISKITGVEIRLFRSEKVNGRFVYTDENGEVKVAPNGKYIPGKNIIMLDINAGINGEGTMLYTLAHELTHYIKEWSPAKFKSLANFLMEQYGKQGRSVDELVQAQIRKAKSNGRTIDYDIAYEEVIADSMEAMLADGKVIEKLQQLYKQDKSLYRKIVDFVNKWVDKVKQLYTEYSPDSKEGKLVLEMKDSLEELQSKFAEALMDATENYQSAGNKATETNLSENVKFSMKSTVEETDKLIAVHNLTADKLISDIKLGGFPMPSIAIVKAKSGHSEFGDISVVFGKKTIDPKASVYNKVYGGDAWTPTYPAVEIETDYETAEKIYADARVVGNITFFNPVNLHPDNISDKINSAGGLDNFIKKYTADYGFKNFYLAETTGKPVSMQTKEETKVISEAEKEQYDYIINALGREAVLKSRAEGVSGRKWFEEFGEKYKAELKKYYLENVPNVTEEIAQSLVDSTPSFQHFKNVVSAAKYIQNGTAETKTVDDYEATHRAIDERINQAEYEQWLREKFNGIAKKSGIRNNVDAYTPMGGRRSFEALHYEETLENVVKVMRSQQNGETFFSGLGIWGVSAKEYRNISEIKADTQRLQSLSKEEYKAIKEGYGERLTEIAQGIKDKSEDNPFIALDNAMDCIVKAVRKSKTKSGIYNNLKKYQQLNVTEMAVDDIVSLIQDIANMPTEYFEAKPQRAVGFDEVEFVVLPQDTKSELVDMLNENGIEYRTYDTSNPDSRVEVLNSKPDIRWSVRDYSYNELISKPDMKVTLLNENVPNNRADIVSSAKKEAAKIGSFDAKTGTVSVYVDDIGNDVVISTKSIRHSLDRRMNVNGPVVLKIGDILKNSIKINELNPREENISESYVLIGTAKNTVDELYVVSFVVNSYTNTIDTVDVLYSANAKTEPAGSLSPRVSTPSTDSAISISDLLDYVNKYFPDILPEDVLKHFGHTQRPEGKLGESALFSDRDYSFDPELVADLQADRDKLKADVANLKELLKLQRTETHGTMFTKTSVNAAASKLMKTFGVNQGKPEIVLALNDFYKYVASSENLNWDSIMEEAGKVANRIVEITPAREQRDDYAEKVLKEIRTVKISLSEEQKSEIASKYGSYNEYRKSNMGSLILSDSGISLERQWQEWLELYPDVFDKEVTVADMPEALVEITSDLRLTRKMVNELNTAEQKQMIANEVYDSYWGVSTLHTLADRHQKQVNLLKSKHNSQMSELRAEYKEREKKTAQRYQEMIKRIREHKNRQMEEYKEAVRVSKERMSEQKKRTVMRNKIKKVVNELNQYLLKGTKDKHIMEGMQKAVAEALSIVNMDTVDADARVAKYDALIAEATDPDVIESLTATRDRIQGQGDRLADKLASLKSAYADIINSSDPTLSNAYDEVIEAKIASVVETVGDTPLRNMSMSQLEEVYDLYKMVLTNIRNANKLFASEKQETIEQLGYEVDSEIKAITKQKDKMTDINQMIRKFSYKELEPIYFFRMLGSDTMTDLYRKVRDGQNTWERNMEEAKEFRINTEKKHSYKEWDLKKTHTFTAKSGKSFDLTLSQIMSIYAFSRREQALDHLIKGGIVFDDAVKVKKKKGSPISYTVNTSEAFNLSADTLGKIVDTLTEEQKSYVKDMQSYLSDTMGAKGNEVSLKLYGVKLFKEKNYFPLKSSQYYMNFTAEEAGETKIKNSSFSKETVKHANNPIVLSDFIDVWANHVNDMSMYHSFVLPLEDFTRVYNYRTPTSEDVETTSVKSTIHNHYTEAANSYIKQLLKDINGGSVSGVGTEVIDKMVGLAKKGAVMASWSVTLQQPSAVFRAMVHIDSKYFINASTLNLVRHKKLWNECKQYAPVAGIKEMGSFDTSVGRTGIDWLKADEYDAFGEKFIASFKSKEQFKNSANDLISFFPAMADELSWVFIWEAVKKETKKTTSLKVGSEEFFKHCGERFTEVIDLTQVYDSVFSRSELMRSKDRSVKMATAFMAEATVQANMIFDSALQLKRGKKSFARAIKTGLILTAAVIVNSLLKSPVGAGRDDDEHESYLEKILGSFAGDALSGLNPLTLIPFVKDVISIIQGYSVERMDMSVIDSLVTAFLALSKETETPAEEQAKWANFVGAVTQLFGVPIKNIYRDVKGAFNTHNTLTSGNETTETGVKFALLEGLSGTVTGTIASKFGSDALDTSKGKQYYDAVMGGDTAHANRIVASYDDKKKADNAIVNALKNFEPRVVEAAQAHIDGNTTERVRISKEIIADGFAQDYVVKAVNGMVTKLEKGEGESESSGKPKSLYTKEDYFNAAYDGNTSEANIYKEELIKFDMETNDKTREEAESSFNSSFKSAVRKAVVKDGLTMEKATRMLADYGDVTEEKAYELAQGYDFVAQHPDLNYGWEADTVAKYLEKAEPAGISVSVYDDYLVKKSQCKGVDRNNDGKADKGTKKAQIYKMIDSLPITSQQKAVLKLMNK